MLNSSKKQIQYIEKINPSTFCFSQYLVLVSSTQYPVPIPSHPYFPITISIIQALQLSVNRLCEVPSFLPNP